MSLGKDVLRCPKCRRDKGLMFYGYLGKAPHIQCPCGVDSKAPAPFDQPWLLERLVSQSDPSVIRYSMGPVPDPRNFA